jgi:hypothetical protein
VCQLSRTFARLKCFSTVAANFLAFLAFSPNSLTYLLDDHPGGNGTFSGRVFTSSGAISFNVTSDSLINEMPLHIKVKKKMNKKTFACMRGSYVD